MVETGICAGLTEQTRTDYGEVAGEEVYGLGADPGVDSQQYDLHSEVVHLACIADIATSAIRRPGGEPWKPAPHVGDWDSGCYLSPDGNHLRRFVLVTSWSEDRHYSLCRAWGSIGEVCMHGLPMQLVAVVLGQHREGKYHSFWTHGLRHPANKKLRFRKKKNLNEPFKESWIEVWREDYNDISTEDWLQGMLEDDVLRDVCIRIDIPVPKPDARQRVIDLAHRKLESIFNTTQLPDQNLSTCDWPQPCDHRAHCHAGVDDPSPHYGFVRIA